MPQSIRGFCAIGFIVSLFLVLAATTSLAASVKRGVVIAKASDDIKKTVEDNGYDVELDDGWTVQFWLSRVLPTGSNSSAGALYPELSNGEFVAVVQFPKGFSDFRGQAIPAGIYTLRYQYIPQDANHMGVSPNPDFLLAIPASADKDPKQNPTFDALVRMSAAASGTTHPAVIALAPARDVTGVAKDDQGMTIFTVAVPCDSKKMLNIGIVLKGQAIQ